MIIKAIILGIIQGLTEFLPVSSTAHLIIIEKYLILSKNILFTNMFQVVIQSGSILAVIIYFRKKIIPDRGIIKNFNFKDKYVLLWAKICAAFFPAAIAGLIFSDKIDELFEKPRPIAYALIAGAILLLIAEKYSEKNVKIDSEHDASFLKAFIVGVFQCLALWPGMSRSGSTIIGGFFSGFSRKAAAEFSFLLSIPTILGAGAYKLIKVINSGAVFTNGEWTALIIGTFVSFLTAYAVIALFMNFIRKNKLSVFAYYRIVLGTIIIIFF